MAEKGRGARERLFGGLTATELAVGLGLPRNRVFRYLKDTERRLGREMNEQDAFLFIYEMIDGRVRNELQSSEIDYVNL